MNQLLLLGTLIMSWILELIGKRKMFTNEISWLSSKIMLFTLVGKRYGWMLCGQGEWVRFLALRILRLTVMVMAANLLKQSIIPSFEGLIQRILSSLDFSNLDPYLFNIISLNPFIPKTFENLFSVMSSE